MPPDRVHTLALSRRMIKLWCPCKQVVCCWPIREDRRYGSFPLNRRTCMDKWVCQVAHLQLVFLLAQCQDKSCRPRLTNLEQHYLWHTTNSYQLISYFYLPSTTQPVLYLSWSFWSPSNLQVLAVRIERRTPRFQYHYWVNVILLETHLFPALAYHFLYYQWFNMFLRALFDQHYWVC